jgi:threonine dehydrogenase-like Zn-dependent dehydrogenase
MTLVAETPRPAFRGTETMRATVFRGPNDIRVESVPKPRAGVGEAVVRVTTTTICGTDIHILKGSPIASRSTASSRRTTCSAIAATAC